MWMLTTVAVEAPALSIWAILGGAVTLFIAITSTALSIAAKAALSEQATKTRALESTVTVKVDAAEQAVEAMKSDARERIDNWGRTTQELLRTELTGFRRDVERVADRVERIDQRDRERGEAAANILARLDSIEQRIAP